MADFEDRLRESMQARAADVTPDPAMYADVQRRIRRSRVTRWSLAGAGAVAVVAVAALVVPSVLDRRIEFEPGPVATQPPTEATETPSEHPTAQAQPTAAGLVFTDRDALYQMALDGESAVKLFSRGVAGCEPEGCDAPITDVALHPGSSFEQATFLTHQAEADCGRLESGVATVSDGQVDNPAGGEIERLEAQCPTAATFSPDGGHVAWALEGTRSGTWSLQVMDWPQTGPRNNETIFPLHVPGPAFDVTVREWVWTTEADGAATGFLWLTAREGSDGPVASFALPIERHAGGAVAVTGEAGRQGVAEGFEVVGFADSGTPGGEVNYTLEARAVDRQWRIVRSDFLAEGGANEVAQLDLSTIASDAPLADLWLEAHGDTVLYGDGDGQAWRVDWEGDGWGDSRAMAATIVHADLFGGAAQEPTDGPVPDDRKLAQVDVDVYFVDDGGECGELVTPQLRSVEGSGVLRGALEHLLAGPTPEEVAAGAADQTGFDAATAGLLNDVSIAENGVARIDFDARLAEQFQGTSCSGNALFSMLEPTVRQFPSVKEVVYSFDGSIEQFYSHYQLEAPAHRPTIPLAVTRMRDRIRDAVVATRDDDWDPLAELIDRETFSCSFSDQNEDCIALWQQQEADGQDPLGPLQEILRGAPAKVDGAPIWAWPVEFVEGDEYLGPRTGIQRNGTWRYYQQGGD